MAEKVKEFKKFPVTCKVILFDPEGRRVLMVKRSEGRYSLPGGHLEEGEMPEEAARRELVEELGLVYKGEFLPGGVTIREKYETLVVFFVGKLDPLTVKFGEMQAEEDILGVEWIDVAEIVAGKYAERVYERYLEAVVKNARRLNFCV